MFRRPKGVLRRQPETPVTHENKGGNTESRKQMWGATAGATRLNWPWFGSGKPDAPKHTTHRGRARVGPSGPEWTLPRVAVGEVFLAFAASNRNGCARGWVSGQGSRNDEENTQHSTSNIQFHRLKARFDFSGPEPAETPDLFSGSFRRSDTSSPRRLRFAPDGPENLNDDLLSRSAVAHCLILRHTVRASVELAQPISHAEKRRASVKGHTWEHHRSLAVGSP
jgi:hypothetical protein